MQVLNADIQSPVFRESCLGGNCPEAIMLLDMVYSTKHGAIYILESRFDLSRVSVGFPLPFE